MRVLVIASSDAENWHIINICKELEHRGHELTVYNTQNHEAVFRSLKAEIKHINELNDSELKKFDLALCGDVGARHLLLHNIYIFVYEISFFRFMPDMADFVLRFCNTKNEIYSLHAAQIPIGNPKNDTVDFLDNNAVENKWILYIDSGHIPFGYKGKAQLGDMLLQVCKENPDHEVVIKPRWVRSQSSFMTHRNMNHIYDVIEERTNGDIPKNLLMLEEHKDLHELIRSSCCVISLNSGAVFDVLSHGKGLCIANGYHQEDKFDFRLKLNKAENGFFEQTSCFVPVDEIHNHVPHGVQGNSEFLRYVLPYKTGASAKAADVMEFVYEKFLKHGKYPAIQNYSYNDYSAEMTESEMSFSQIKQIRFENRARKNLTLFQDQLSVALDFSEARDFIEKYYVDYQFTRDELGRFFRDVDCIKNKILRANRKTLMRDAIDQDFLMKALYDTGYDDEILNMQENEILAIGPHHFYTAQILRERGETDEAVKHYIAFLEEANSRSFEKFLTEISHGGYKTAYTELFKLYDGENVPPHKMCELIHGLHESKRAYLLPYELHNKVYEDLYSDKAGVLVDEKSKAFYHAGKHIMAHEQFGKDFFLQNEINHLHDVIESYKREWFGIPHKIWNGLRCIRHHGLLYTIKYGLKEKFLQKLCSPFKTPMQMLRNYKSGVMRGYKLYKRVMYSYGENAYVYLTSASMGDPYIFGAKFNAFCKRQPSNQIPIYAVYQTAGEKIARLFAIKNIAQFDFDEIRNLYHLLIFKNKKTSVRIYSFHSQTLIKYPYIGTLMWGFKGLTFYEAHDHFAYSGIADNEKLLPVFNDEGIDDIYKKYMLTSSKVVVLSPYAKGVGNIPEGFWENLAKNLQATGYMVCTNCGIGKEGEAESVIKGTTGVFIPFDKLVSFLGKSTGLIALRSGFQDVSESADCLNISIQNEMEKGKIFYGSLNDVYSMEVYYGRPNMHDLLYTPRTETALIDKIANMVVEYTKNKEENK